MDSVTQAPLLERIAASPLNYWATLVTDLVVAMTFAGLGAKGYHGSPAGAMALVLAGIVGWPLLEYALHRWLLHGRWSKAFRKEHARHHGDPQAVAGTPWLASASLALAIWFVLTAVMSGPGAALVMAGVYAGYIYFVVVHYLQHYHSQWMERWWFYGNQMHFHERHHDLPHSHFGITTSIWDRVFGTFDVELPSRFLEHDEVVVERPGS
ncbi:MAG: sterol desaturase family protein [Acidobacteriota bacterium]